VNVKKVVRRTLLGLAIVVVLGIAAIFYVIGPRNVFGMLRYDQRREGDLKVGSQAPDVALVSLDGRTPVQISNAIGEKPLVIVFGSYT
jgi:hypothetical protein